MLNHKNNQTENAKKCLIEAAGRTSQDFGMGRIVGQVMAAVYLKEEVSSLDDISKELGLSKAAVSIATRQLDKLGLLQRAWTQGDRKTYYRASDNFAATLQHGILEMLRGKLRVAGDVLDQAEEYLKEAEESHEKEFLSSQVKRGRHIRKRADQILNNPLIKLIGG